MKLEKEIKLSQKILDCRESAKKLYGSDYEKHISDYKRFIKGAMVKHKIDSELKAAMKLIEDIKDEYGADVATMNILAAFADLIEEKL